MSLALLRKVSLGVALSLWALVSVSMASAAEVGAWGLTAEIPEGWSVHVDEQLVICDAAESSAVIVDRIASDGNANAMSVAQGLAGALGIEEEVVARDGSGSPSFQFEQDGERVSVRVLDGVSCVLMIYAFGEGQEVSRVAGSIAVAR